jgi:hypothetical protein
MSTISKLYRKDIAHEEVNTVGLFLNDQWQYQKEEITISQFNNLANHAVVIGNGKTCNEFDLTKILPSRATTRWGEIGPWVDKRQRRNFFTYGCNALYRNYKPDFLIATGDGIVKEIAESRADKSNVVYTYSKNLEKYPGKFNILPQNPDFNAGAIAAYMAAFDGHKKVFLLGFDGVDSLIDNGNMFADTPNYPAKDYPTNTEFWIRSLNTVMSVYSDTEFIRVCPSKDYIQPEMWKFNLNYRQIDFRRFVLEADI